MNLHPSIRLGAIVALATVAIALAACSQFEPRDKRFYYRALWNFALREDLAELDSEFNGVDFGHSNLYENLLLTGGTDVSAIEDRARKETLAFIATKPRLNPNEEAIAPTYMKLAWRAQNTFDEAHALHARRAGRSVLLVTKAQVTEIAKLKMPDLIVNDLDAAVRTVEGTARSMGLEVVG